MRGVRADRGGEEIIQDQQIRGGDLSDELQALRIVIVHHRQLRGQVIGAEEPGGVVTPARRIQQRQGQIGLAHRGLPQQDDVAGISPDFSRGLRSDGR